MKNDPISNHAMARVYRSAVAVSALIFSVSALAADPPVPRGNVSVNLNPTTGYYSVSNTTLRLPDGVRATTSAGLPVVTKYPSGLQQSIPTGITIDAIKKTAPLSAVVRSTTQSVKGAATRCLTSARCNIALLLAGEGLSRLLDGLDWVMDEGGKVVRLEHALPTEPSFPVSSVKAAAWCTLPCTNYYIILPRPSSSSQPSCFLAYPDEYLQSYSLGTGSINTMRCTYTRDPAAKDFGASYQPVSPDDIQSEVDKSYVPEPSDWPALTPELALDDVEITSSPTLQGEPRTTTVYDADGNPHKITETNIWYDFDIRDNPSPQPKLDVKKREETKTYEEGVLTGTTITNSTDSAGSDDTPPPPPESPIDCDLFPTACAWFEWTKEEPVEPDDDLSTLLREVPIVSETYTITGGVAACPAPLVLDLSVFGSREVSYQPLCDLASTMKFLYLALMSFAAAVLLHRSINRV